MGINLAMSHTKLFNLQSPDQTRFQHNRRRPRRMPRRRLALMAAAAAPVLAAAARLSAATTIGQAGDGAPDFFYDAATGDVRFFYDGFTPLTVGGETSILSGLSLQSASGKFIVANVNPTFASGLGPTLLPTWLASSISAAPGFTDGFDIGNVLPSGLTAATLTGDLTLKYQTLTGGSLKSASLVFTAPAPSPVNVLSGPGVLWSDSGNWSLSRAPAPGDRISLTATNAGSRAITIDVDAPNLTELRADSAVAAGSLDITLGAARSLSVQGSVTLGYSGAASFTQSSGSNSTAGSLFLGVTPGSSGTYNLSGGAVSASQVLVGAGTNAGGMGLFNQTGGNVLVARGLVLGGGPGASGTYNLSGAASLTVGGETIGARGRGVFNQYGGTHVVNGSLTLNPNYHDPGSAAVFNLSGGTLSVAATEYLSANALLNQTGGQNSCANFDVFAGGTAVLSGGSFTALAVENWGNIILGGGITTLGSNVYNSATGKITIAAGSNSVTVPSIDDRRGKR
jgi:hypothetical protein